MGDLDLGVRHPGMLNPPEDATRIPAENLPLDSLIAFDVRTGAIAWAYRPLDSDYWNSACVPFPTPPDPAECPKDVGPDYDFAQGAVFVHDVYVPPSATDGGAAGGLMDLFIARNKEGTVHAVDAQTGAGVWKTKVGPESMVGLGGMAYDGHLVFTTVENTVDLSVTMTSDGPQVVFSDRRWRLDGDTDVDECGTAPCSYGGMVAALDPATGDVVWENTDDFNRTPTFPFGPIIGQSSYLAPPTTANGLVYASGAPFLSRSLLPGYGAEAPDVFAFDARSGQVLWSHALMTDDGSAADDDEVVIAATVITGGQLLVGSRGGDLTSHLRAFGLP